MHSLVESMKKIALRAIAESQPTAIEYGKVISASPLKINVEQKLTLDENHLILTSNVKEHEVFMTVDHKTEIAEAHEHEYKGRKKFIVHNNLSVGEKVILIRMQGGQKYIVLDRVVT